MLKESYELKTSHESRVLDTDKMLELASKLPTWVRFNAWKRIFCMAEHGTALDTLYEKCQGSTNTVLVIKDTLGSVFGGFCTTPWENYGTF